MAEESNQEQQKQVLSGDQPQTHHNWYIRKNNKLSGPFPAGQISQLLVVGRLTVNDMISHDKESWLKISDVPGLIPEVLTDDGDGQHAERLAAARRWADERREERRLPSKDISNRQSHGRRNNEQLDDIEYRNRRESIYRTFREKPKRAFSLLIIFILSVTGLLWGAFNYSPMLHVDEPDCFALPQPKVNWRNCNKSQLIAVQSDLSESNLHSVILRNSNLYASNFNKASMDYSNLSGSNLSQSSFVRAKLKGASFKNSDLRRTNFKGADLTYSDFSNANITFADFTDANLAHAIWINGKVCRAGSVGRCQFK